MSSVDDLEELIATRKLHRLDDGLFKEDKKMKLKDILDMEEYLKERCYCPGEIYSIDGFFYQVFRANADCYEIGRCELENNKISKVPYIAVIANSTDEISQLLIIMHNRKKIIDIVRFDATENNIKLIKEVIKNNKTDLKFNEYKEGETEKSLEKIFKLADAIMIN